VRRQDVLAQFGAFALRCDDLDEIEHEACRLISEALETDFAKVLELQDDGVTLLVRAGVGWKPGIVGKLTVEAKEGSAEWLALQTGEPVISTNLDEERRFQCAPFIRESGVKALVNVNIIGPEGKRAYGILEVDSRTPRVFTEEDTTFLLNYANLLAAAVERFRGAAEARLVEAALRESEDHYRVATELNPQIPWTADPEGRLINITHRWLDFTGLSADQALGGGWMQVIHPDDVPAIKAAWRRSLDAGEPYEAEARIRTADGSYRWLRIQAFPRREGGEITRWYGTTEDIEDRRRMEAALREWSEMLEARVADRTRALEREQAERQATEDKLRQAQKMEAVGQLTGGLAHDFNNLLTGITGALELTQHRLRQGRVADVERYIGAAMTSAGRAATLTQRLLAFARKQALDPKVVRPDRLVASLEELLRRTVGPSIAVETVLPADLSPIRCDPNQLENALLNLVINARDAMPEGGTLGIKAANVTVDHLFSAERDMEAGDYVSLSVTDTGIGMSPEVVKRAFDPFFTTKPIGEGTGLGLSMIYGFAKQSGGQVRIHSNEGMGTSVTIYLPRHDGEVAPDQAAVHKRMPKADDGESVLVVDDEEVVRMLILDVLDDLGYAAIDAADGDAALRLVEENPNLDLLITDLGLPGAMNGRQLADVARMRHPGLKVLFITGFAEAEKEVGRLGPGMELMTKPFAMGSLATLIRSLLEARDRA
jgi:PAS domain S-box-containing protein